MSLPRSFKRPAAGAPARLALLAVVAMLAGCAGGGAEPRAPAEDRETLTPVSGEAALEAAPEAQGLFQQAVAVLAAGDYVEAELRFEEFILQYPNFPGAHVNLAIVHAKNGDEKAAEDSITDALILDPRHAQALNQLGMLLRRQGKFEEAEAAYLRAIDAAPDYALAHYNLGVLYELYLRRLELALAHYERYQAVGGDDAAVEKWIVDLKRRIAANQRAANVTE